MKTEQFRVEVLLPSVADFVGQYPHYLAAGNEEAWLFDLIVTPETFVRATALTETMNLPAVSAIADEITRQTPRSRGGLSRFRKQLAGAVVCALMEANGYEKTGTKRAISRRGWSRGEVYQRRAGRVSRP